jgi:hypothetical protein
MFLVVGSSGEYDEYRTWPVVAFAERSTAATYAELATKWSIEGRAAYCARVALGRFRTLG